MKHFTVTIKLLSLALLVVFSACGGGNSSKGNSSGSDEKYTLEYNLKTGDTFKQNVVMDADIIQEAMGQEIKINTKMSMAMTYEVTDVQNGLTTMVMKYDEMKMNMSNPMSGEITFDSNTTAEYATPQDMSPMFKAIIGIPVEVVVDKTGKVKSASGFEKLADAMVNSMGDGIDAGTRELMLTQLGEQFSEESIKSMFEQSMLPDKPVGIGDKWDMNTNTKSGNMDMAVSMKMELKNVDNNVATIEGEGTLGTDKPIIQETNGMEVKVTMKGTQKSVVKVDMNTGQTINATINQDITGESEVMNMKIPMKMTSKITISN